VSVLQCRPVLILSPLCLSHVGNERPKNREKPNMHRFLDELRSTYCRFDTPTAAIIPVAITTALENSDRAFY